MPPVLGKNRKAPKQGGPDEKPVSARQRSKKVKAAGAPNDPLTQLFERFHKEGRVIERVPASLKEAARSYIESRIAHLGALRIRSDVASRSRIDHQSRWLGRWLTLCALCEAP